jgi:hypothetical protein
MDDASILQKQQKSTGENIARNWINIRKLSLSSVNIVAERFLP